MAIQLTPLGTYATGQFDESAAEIVAYDSQSQRLFVVNAQSAAVDVLDIRNPNRPTLLFSIDVTPYGNVANSVDVSNGVVAIAVEVESGGAQQPGNVAFFNVNGGFLRTIPVGALPDALTFTPDGQRLVVANEGEPNDEYTVDPEGSISVIDLSNGLEQATVATADFTAFNSQVDALRARGVRIFGPNATVAQDLEPEFVTVTPDSSTAVVTLQENNAVAVVDLETATVTEIRPLGVKDAAQLGNGFDASDRDGRVDIRNHPVFGLYQPDAIDTFTVGGSTYFITANEGDARDYDGFSEEARVKDLTLDPGHFPNASELQADSNLGRLKTTTTLGDLDGDGDVDQIFAFGGRSFTVWDTVGNVVFDSGEQLERITLANNAEFFNSTNDENNFDNRSDDKGPEPEAVTVGQINGEPHVFVGLERVGGVAVFNLSNPAAPEFVQYVNNRDFSGDPEAGTAGDLGPEDIEFIGAAESPIGRSLLAVSNEVSGTTTLYGVGEITRLQILAASDLEGGVDAISDAPNFAAVVEGLETDADNKNIPSILLSAGDNYLPGPFFNAAGDRSLRTPLQNFYSEQFGVTLDNVREGVGRLDISIMNALGFDASAVGNHEFDAGTATFESIIGADIRGDELGDVRWAGAQFPYLSANLDFSDDDNLSGLFTSEILDSTDFRADLTNLDAAADAPAIAPATVIERDGELIGVVGATTPSVGSISSTGGVQVLGTTTNDINVLASILQPTIDQLRARGINKIVTLTHLQQFQLEQQLVPQLRGVDVAIAGGSDTLLADETDRLRAGDVATEPFPVLSTNADGEPVAIVSADGQYSYVGRLVVDFDANGVLIHTSINAAESGAYATDAQGVTDVWNAMAPGQSPFGPGTQGNTVQNLVGSVQNIVTSRDGEVFGASTVYLEGRRSAVRTEETNLGNLTADANLAAARAVDPAVLVSIKNGGGIRDSIGRIDGLTGELEPTEANPLAGKTAGQISQLDIEGTLRFNNGLTLLTMTAAQLQQVIEHGVSQSGDGATPGRFPQVGGVSFSFDASLPENQRVRSLAITDDSGAIIDTVVQNGALVGDPNRQIRIVTLDFLAGGGDSYPFDAFANANPVDLETDEQTALGNFLTQLNAPFSTVDTTAAEDTRIQNLSQRADTVLDGATAVPTPPSPTNPIVDQLTGLTLQDVFDETFYRSTNPDVEVAIANGDFASALDHFTRLGQFEGRNPIAFFDTGAYLLDNPDVFDAVASGLISPAHHYASAGSLENRAPSGFFNPVPYLASNPDVAAAIASDNFSSAAFHFFKAGVFEGRAGF